VQAVVDQAILRMGQYVNQRTGLDRLALAGGVALNCVATGKLSSEGPFRTLWTQPAAGDAGGAVGAALWFWHQRLNQPRVVQSPDGMRGSFLGTEIPPVADDDDRMLRRLGAVWEALSDDELQHRIADRVAAGKVVSIARGRMEFGPRALGARSILGDARSETMQSHMNLKIKFREGFRPFAPIVLVDDADQ
jgi:carbamoyltransferase